MIEKDTETTRHNGVSLWEIEPSGSASTPNNFNAAGLKRTRIDLPSSKQEFPVPNGIGTSDFGESLRFQKVFQGHEILGVNIPFDGISAQSHPFSEIRRWYHGSSVSRIAPSGNNFTIPQVHSDGPCNGIGFSESFRFQKVLQGQEILPSQPYGRTFSGNDVQGNGRHGIFDSYQMLSSRNGWTTSLQDNNSTNLHPSVPSGPVSSPSSVFMVQQAVNPTPNCDYNNGITNQRMESKMQHQGLQERAYIYKQHSQ